MGILKKLSWWLHRRLVYPEYKEKPTEKPTLKKTLNKLRREL